MEMSKMNSNDFQNIDSLDDRQKATIFNRMQNTNRNMYITGKAGTGKSYLLAYFKNHTKKNVAVVAPTGIAALNVGGQTIHSFFGLKPEPQYPEKFTSRDLNSRQATILKNIDTIVIDEASMVRVDMLDAIDRKLKIANHNELPFGGKQIIMFGDLYQLPPVVDNGQIRRFLEDKYGGVFFFNAPVLKNSQYDFYELINVYRQKEDPAYIALLNDIREGTVTQNEIAGINARISDISKKSEHAKILTICPRNSTVDYINERQLSKITNKEYIYRAEISGDFKQSAYPTATNLKLKVGAQVIMLTNDQTDSTSPRQSEQRRWVNGTLAVVSELRDDGIKIMINGVEHEIDKHTWNKKQYEYDEGTKKLKERNVASFTQYPVRLAWAMTIHKAQGQTYQSVALDLDGGAFAPGQVYVALSRCKELKDVYLVRPLQRSDIIVNQEVIDFMKRKSDDTGCL